MGCPARIGTMIFVVSFVASIAFMASESAAAERNQEANAPQSPVSPEDSLKYLHVLPGMRVELVAAEPLIRDPVAFDWGADGKLWGVE